MDLNSGAGGRSGVTCIFRAIRVPIFLSPAPGIPVSLLALALGVAVCQAFLWPASRGSARRKGYGKY